MKRFSIFLTLFFAVITLSLKAQCLPGFGPNEHTITLNIGNCQMIVHWCCPTNWSASSPYEIPPVSITRVEIPNVCYSGALQLSLGTDGKTHWDIPWDRILLAIYSSRVDCLNRVPDLLEPCETGEWLTGRAGIGYCYRWVGEGVNMQTGEVYPSHYEICNMQPSGDATTCYDQFQICQELGDDGNYYMKLVWNDAKYSSFVCEPGCQSGCYLGEEE